MRVALCQLPVSSDPAVNLTRVKEAIAQAAAEGAGLAVFPEATQVRFGSDLRGAAEPLDGPFGAALASAARDYRTALIAGVFEPAPGGLVYNTAVGYDRHGNRCAAYRKIHLFDALGQRESDIVAPGTVPVIAEFDGLRVGLITCYDIRFPELARTLAVGGAQLLVVPAAWGAGLFKEEHWVTLVRARAIENTVWVAAVGQVPDHGAPRVNAPTGVGRSMLVDPMGTVRIDLGSRPVIAVGDVDPELTEQIRDGLPCLQHRRPDILGEVRGGVANGL